MCFCDIVCDLLEDYYSIAVTNWSYLMKVQRRKKFTSIVQKVISRSITGQGLGLTVHAHTGLTFHLSWNPGVRKGSFQNCIARHTVQSAVWYAIIRQIRRRGLTGVCKCVYGTDMELGEEIIEEVCFYTAYAGIRYYCRCKYAFSLEIGENYRTSIFLTEGCMMLFEAARIALGEC